MPTGHPITEEEREAILMLHNNPPYLAPAQIARALNLCPTVVSRALNKYFNTLYGSRLLK